MDTPDLRHEELTTLLAIYHDLAEIDTDAYRGSIAVPVSFDTPLAVNLTAECKVLQLSLVSHFPPLTLRFWLPPKYPYEQPPLLRLECDPLPPLLMQPLQESVAQVWRDLHDQALFSVVSLLQEFAAQSPAELFGTELQLADPVAYDMVLLHDKNAAQLEFDRKTFTCEICQRSLKGTHCHQFDPCSHTFCTDCLRSFFESLIESGEVERVHCPDFQCGKQILDARENLIRLDNLARENFDFEQFKLQILTPPLRLATLQQILNDSAKTSRYLSLFNDHQHVLIAKLFPLRLVSCPRKHCTGMVFREDLTERLVYCRKCKYAFCNNCRKSYHSASIDCAKRDNLVYAGISVEDIQLWIAEGKETPAGNELRCRYGHELLTKVADEYTMDQMFSELLKKEAEDFGQCPTCKIVVQRLEGCNKMKCSACYTPFCYLCGEYLDPDHPYDHFKERESTCYNRLFDGMPGTEGI